MTTKTRIWKHRKGGLYLERQQALREQDVSTEHLVQSLESGELWLIPESSADLMQVYTSAQDGRTWGRENGAFRDGRFTVQEPHAAPATPMELALDWLQEAEQTGNDDLKARAEALLDTLAAQALQSSPAAVREAQRRAGRFGSGRHLTEAELIVCDALISAAWAYRNELAMHAADTRARYHAAKADFDALETRHLLGV